MENALVRHDSPQHRRGQKRKMSLTSCDTCDGQEAKYRCPSCLKYSCSLACVKQHKLVIGCSGVRDQTAFVPLAQFEEINLLNDYRFLEETARVADMPRRDALLHGPPHHVRLAMARKSARMAKVTLKLLPKSFSRHRENTTFYSKAERKLYWHLKLLFPQCRAECTDRVPEDRVLQDVLVDYVHPTESDPVKRQRLKIYVPAFPDQLCVFLKSEQRRPDSPRYHELDVNKSLRENMRYKTVLEYPEVHVVLKGHLEEYLTRFPGRSRTMDQSDSHIGSISVPMAPGAPPPREGRTLGTHAETELEEGEIRSDEEDEKDEHEHHGYGAGGVYQNVTVETDIGLPHDVQEKKMDDFKYSAIAEDQSVTMETQDQDSDVDDRVAADNDQSVTMETGVFPSSSHYVHLVDGDIGHLVDVDSLGNPIVQNVEDRPLLVEVGGKDQQDETGSTAIEETNGSVGTPDRPPGVDQRDTTGSAVIEETNVSVGTPNRPPVVDHRDTTGSAVIADTNVSVGTPQGDAQAVGVVISEGPHTD
ncbi:uncharacterized protein znhit6 [Electrophorus electricus]|uniref:Box C/D snoRNA protein 1 n=1 Tax=Electrophorus electricus TaxID=8005 RepID=A0A4W4FY94_ELEEL|nr:uncharacterized protein znhit6 [Electrophorus electricus]